MGKSQLANVKLGNGRDELPECPKPCRPAAAVPEFLYPLSCQHRCTYVSLDCQACMADHQETISPSSNQGSSEILSMISTKGNEGRESMSTGCPPSCYCGSPPTRLDNPLVHDARFIHQAELLERPARRNLSDSLGFTSSSPI